MKKKTFIAGILVLCIAFSSINVIKSSIKNLRFLLTMSKETLANAEAIDGEGEGSGEKEGSATVGVEYTSKTTCTKEGDYLVTRVYQIATTTSCQGVGFFHCKVGEETETLLGISSQPWIPDNPVTR